MADITETFQLVRRAQAGDAHSLERLFRRYYDRIRRIVKIRMGPMVSRFEETDDVLQRTFAVAVRRFSNFEMRDEAAFRNWLAKLAENQIRGIVDHYEAGKRPDAHNVELDGIAGDSEDGWQPEAHETQPDISAERGEARDLVDRCIAELPEHYRELILLRNYEGHAWLEVARRLGRPSSGAARMMHAQAMLELARRIREHADTKSA